MRAIQRAVVAAIAILAPAGVISTVAGGVGGPAMGTKVALTPCEVSFGAGHLFIADRVSVRRLSPGSPVTPARPPRPSSTARPACPWTLRATW